MQGFMKIKIKKDIEALTQEINEHNHRYHVLDDPTILDSEYDLLFRKLQILENENPEFIQPNSPTQKVGNKPAKTFDPVKHSIPLLSLDNAFSDDELRDFDSSLRKLNDGNSIEYIVEPKMDGLAVEIVYKDGRLSVASTRGDGEIGENVTENIKTIQTIPQNLISRHKPYVLEVRGEVIMEKKVFEEVNKKRIEEGYEPFANPRNAAAGSLRQLDSNITRKRCLSFYSYGSGLISPFNFHTYYEIMVFLQSQGLPVNFNQIIYCNNIDEVIEQCHRIEKTRDQFPFEIDGAVIKVIRLDLQEKFGMKTRSPRWAIARKFKPVPVETIVKNIEIQVGRTGALTPVAILEPVSVGGVTVSRATLHNQDEINKKDIRIGDTVLIQRAGDVIPEVVESVKSKRTGAEKEFVMPDNCPVCGTYIPDENKEVVVRCPNKSCPAQVIEGLAHFVSKGAMDIDGMGDKLLTQLILKGLVRKPVDIYRLTKEKLLTLDKVEEKSANNILAAIEKSKKTTLARFIYALGIRHVGEGVAQILADHFKNIEKLNFTIEELLSIPNIGPQISESIFQYFVDFENIDHIHDLIYAGITFEEKVTKESSITGKTLVVTGTLHKMKRAEIEKFIMDNGGKVGSSVGKGTDILVVGENAGSKLDRAKELGTQILTEDEFWGMF